MEAIIQIRIDYLQDSFLTTEVAYTHYFTVKRIIPFGPASSILIECYVTPAYL